jgi:hypothetical protein
MLTSPLLFLVFNRPEPTQRVFERIREARPKQLFIAADGPRPQHPTDAERCQAVREYLLAHIDWDCELYTLFRDQNLGCGQAVSQAITWFFEHVPQGIILEDDTLPDPSFFYFCQTLLHHYQDDERVMMVSGYNALGLYEATEADYFFSRIGAIWGWATWRRAWQHYTQDPEEWEEAKRQKLIEQLFIKDPNQAAHRQLVLEKTFNKEIDTWDYYWTFTRLSQSGLSILPKANLVQNIGFGEDATHTKTANQAVENTPVYTWKNTNRHPRYITISEFFDDEVFYQFINYRINPSRETLARRVLAKILHKR